MTAFNKLSCEVFFVFRQSWNELEALEISRQPASQKVSLPADRVTRTSELPYNFPILHNVGQRGYSAWNSSSTRVTETLSPNTIPSQYNSNVSELKQMKRVIENRTADNTGPVFGENRPTSGLVKFCNFVSKYDYGMFGFLLGLHVQSACMNSAQCCLPTGIQAKLA